MRAKWLCMQDGHFRFVNGDNIGSRCAHPYPLVPSHVLLRRDSLCGVLDTGKGWAPELNRAFQRVAQCDEVL
jgi:hypothetical protein